MKFSFPFWITKDKKPLHWYQVKLHYKINGLHIFDFSTRIGVENQLQILDSRAILKSMAPLHKLDYLPRHLLKNGVVWPEITCYLGHFEKQEKK